MTTTRAPAAKPKRKSQLEERFAFQIRAMQLPEPRREYRFAAPERQWRFDFAWLDRKIAVELNGAIFQDGRHSRGSGLLGDYEKLNAAQRMGWKVYQFGSPQIVSGEAINFVAAEFGIGE